ncbi:DnaD domain protein [Bacillus mesophilus]|uniref:DnaD domain protein n=2 Tax=Bacillus mesophilus TaxID=1808955 RepID=A0A6M0QD15_9BACI|nr:DnaD domain protein [Bacillus mesophilus]
MVRTDFWLNPVVSEEMTPEDRYFFLYLLTNPHTTQVGIYKITKKQMAFDMGYSIESVEALMNRFIQLHQVIRYNPDTRELAIKNWGKYNLHKGGKPVMDCILSELKNVEDSSLIAYVAECVDKEDILAVYESFCTNDEGELEDFEGVDESCHDTLTSRYTIRGQKEEEKEKENKKQQQHSLNSSVDIDLERESLKKEDVKEVVEFWDQNGFGFSNIHAKQQLLYWLYNSSFLQPKDMILKAMEIACSSNIRRLNYVVGILRNWENDSVLTLEEIDTYDENKKQGTEHRKLVEPDKPSKGSSKEFQLDLTAGEDW